MIVEAPRLMTSAGDRSGTIADDFNGDHYGTIVDDFNGVIVIAPRLMTSTGYWFTALWLMTSTE